MPEINRDRLSSLMASETKKFIAERPKSAALFERARKSLLGGVPMNWMVKWAGAFPPFVAEAQGAEVVDVDGHRYVDFCLGDTGAMTGHSPAATVLATQQQLNRGITLMLPNEDAIHVGEELQRRFRLPCWQFALSATDANRFPFGWRGRLPAAPKFWFSTGAITAPWTKPLLRWKAVYQNRVAEMLVRLLIPPSPRKLSSSMTLTPWPKR